MLSFDEFKGGMLKRPSNFMYSGDLDLTVWGFAPFGTNRDASLLQQSNHDYVVKELRKVSGKSVCVEHFSHWLVGWCESIMVRTTATKTMERLYEIYEQSEQYAVLDDEDFCRRECEQAHEAYDNWAKWPVGELAEAADIRALLDGGGNFDPTDEQEDKLRHIVTDCILDFGGDNEYNDKDVIESMREEFTPPTDVEVAEAAGQRRLVGV